MLHVCNAIDRISCYFDSIVDIMAERSFRVNLNVQIIFLHALNYMMIIPIGQVGTFFANLIISLPDVSAILKKMVAILNVWVARVLF